MGLRLLITCLCGREGRVEMGAAWRCDACGRSWDTAGIPPESYRRFAGDLRHAKRLALTGLVLIVPLFALLAVVVSPALLPLGAVALGVWYFLFLPGHRRRVQALYAQLPRLETHRLPGGSTTPDARGADP